MPAATLEPDHMEEPENKRSKDKTSTFFEHLEELRARIFRVLIYVCLAMGVGFWIEPYFYESLTYLLRSQETKLPQGSIFAFQNITEPFFFKLKVSFILGLMIAMPLIMREIWGFISPALTPRERRTAALLAPFSAFLFAIGVGLGYFIMPAALRFFVGFLDEYQGTVLMQNPGQYIFFVVRMMLAFGLGFQLPIVMMFLAKVGLMTPEVMWRSWRYALVAIAAAAALITPSGDAFSMMAIGAPMSILYFLSIFFVARIAKQRKLEGI